MIKNLKFKTKNPKVIVAMSGGVDSSVAAALLKKQGFDVLGAFMRFWHETGSRENRCCSSESEKRARKVASRLGIPFYVLNFRAEFKEKVVDLFLKEYKSGRTPNPCVVCNKEIKFGLLLRKALDFGADYVATGHYAMVKSGKLLRAKDKQKDQSYFLWQLSQNQLRRILFPVGDYTKKEIRKLAKRFNLPVFDVSESQEVCFIPRTVNAFLTKHIEQKKPGDIVDVRGNKIGRHQGLVFYTIGQRKGIGLSGGPYWVLGKDLKRNILIITKNEKDLLKKELFFKNINWISGKSPKFPLKVRVKIRYRHASAFAILLSGRLVFDRPQRAATPGQSAVFYKNEKLIGGGQIC